MSYTEVDVPQQPVGLFYVSHGKDSLEEKMTTASSTITTDATTPNTRIQKAGSDVTATAEAATMPATSVTGTATATATPSKSAATGSSTPKDEAGIASQPRATTLHSDEKVRFDSDHHDPDRNAESSLKRPTYESRVPIDRASTSYSLFSSDPLRFSMDRIRESTHYLTDRVQGRIWIDGDGDGRRGDRGNVTLSDVEFDKGIGGVQVQLIDCRTNEPIADPISSQPLDLHGGNPVVSINEDESAGLYSFPLESIPGGRYYLLYAAPTDYRISSNVLPLERNAPSFDCIPKGGEGGAYLHEARVKGDFEFSGYCARSIGCFEVDDATIEHKKSNFDTYSKLEVLDNGALEEDLGGDYRTYEGKLVAVPFVAYFSVGLVRERWELSTYQYADLEVTLTFPLGADLGQAVPRNFEESDARRRLEEGLVKFLGARESRTDEFVVASIDVLRGKILLGAEDDRKPLMTRRKLLRSSSTSTTNLGREVQELPNRVRYALTARGQYRPPPRLQLGSVIEDSINSDPQRAARSLEDDGAFPDGLVVEGIIMKWLTMKEPAEATEVAELQYGGFAESWAFALVVSVLAGCILMGACLLGLQVRARVAAKCGPKQVESMNVVDIIRELKSYGISTANIRGRKKLEHALVKARLVHSSRVPIKGKKVGLLSFATVFTSFSSSAASTDPSLSSRAMHADAHRRGHDRQEQVTQAMKRYESLKVSELKRMLRALGVSASGFSEKRELVRALAGAGVAGTNVENVAAAKANVNKDRHITSYSHLPMKQALPRQREVTPISGRGRMNYYNARSLSRQRGGAPSPERGSIPINYTRLSPMRHRVAPSQGRGGVHGDNARSSPSPVRARKSQRKVGRQLSPTPRPNGAAKFVRPVRPRSKNPIEPARSRPCPDKRLAQENSKRRTRSEDISGGQLYSNTSARSRPEDQYAPKPRSSDRFNRSSSETRNIQSFPSGDRAAKGENNRNRSARRQCCKGRNSRPHLSKQTRSEGDRTTRSDERRDGPTRSRSDELCAAKSCPSNTFRSSWDEAKYYSRFYPSEKRKSKEKRYRSRSAQRPRSKESKDGGRARRKPRARSKEPQGRLWSEEQQESKRNASGSQRNVKADPPSKSFRRNGLKHTVRFARSSGGIDSLFDNGHSSDVRSAPFPPDPPEMERPPPNDPVRRDFSSIRDDLKAAEPWMMW